MVFTLTFFVLALVTAGFALFRYAKFQDTRLVPLAVVGLLLVAYFYFVVPLMGVTLRLTRLDAWLVFIIVPVGLGAVVYALIARWAQALRP